MEWLIFLMITALLCENLALFWVYRGNLLSKTDSEMFNEITAKSMMLPNGRRSR